MRMCALLVILTIPSYGKTITVALDGTGDHSDIQSAIDQASSSGIRNKQKENSPAWSAAFGCNKTRRVSICN